MQYVLASILILLLISAPVVQCSLSYDPADYLEVYPDPRDPEVLKGRTPLHFALIQSLGGQLDGSGTLAGVKVALDRINNDSSLLPGYTLHYTFANSKCDRTVSLDALYSQLFHEPKKLAIIGSGCSVATEPTAEISHYYNITQISCLSSSGILGNRVRFPSYFQLLATMEKLAIGYFGVIRKFGWRRIALIVQDENLWTATMNRLKPLLNQTDVEYNEKLFNTSAGIAALGPNPFDEDSKIFLLSMFSITALPFLCEAYHRGIRSPEYVIMTVGRFRINWWRQEILGLTCTADQRESVLHSSLAFTDNYFLNEVKDANVTATSGITGREFFAEERKYLGQPPLNITYFQYSQYCHDATWTLAYALNHTLNSLSDSEINDEIAQAFNVTPPFRLEDFTYNSPKLKDITFQHLANTSFNGITGPVSFGDQGIRKLDTIIIFQFRESLNATDGTTYLDLVEIGKVNERFDFMYVGRENITTVWQGLIPYDGVPREEIVSIHPAITGVYIPLASAGIAFAIACLIFNFVYRSAKLMKLASTKLNYLIGIGAIILYLDIFFFVVPSTEPSVVIGFCNLTPWLTAIGYSLCYGTILAKMARVYYIFNNPSTNKKIIKDKILILGVAALVAVDITILVTYTLVEGIRGNLVAQKVSHKEIPTTVEGELGIITNNFIYVCESTARDIFLGILYGYKMALQVIALVLAFAIRKVKVKGLDDAKYIGVTIYVTSIMLAVTILATYSMKNVINGFAALFCTGFLIGTSAILGLVFVPQMVGLYRDPNGESIFEKSTAVASHPSLAIVKENGTKISDSETLGLRRRIRELDEEVKELKAVAKKQELESPESILLSTLQASQMVDVRTSSRTIYDTPEEREKQKINATGNSTAHEKIQE